MLGKKKTNSVKVVIDNIEFQSRLEGFCYEQLKLSNLDFRYEPYSYELLKKFKPDNIVKLLKISDMKDKKKPFYNDSVRDIVYTPDFVMETNGKIFVIEVKGNPNERYPLVRKLFFDLISKDKSNIYYFFEPHTQREILKTIELIKDIIMVGLNAIKIGMSLVEGKIKAKDFKLLDSLIETRKFDDAILLVRSVIKIVSSKKEKEEGDSMLIVNLTSLNNNISEYYAQINGEEEEWD